MSEVSRRAVLRGGAGVVALAFLGLEATPAEAAGAARAVAPRRRDYTPFVNETFIATHGRRSHRIKLLRIRDVQGAGKHQRDGSFNLIFATTRPLPDGIYAVHRRGVSSHSLFLSRVGTEPTMQALVNRSR
jgi:hypothetical protein